MKPKQSNGAPPFWVDGDEGNLKRVEKMRAFIIGFSKLFGAVILICFYFMMAYFICVFLSPSILWIFGAWMILTLVQSYLVRRNQKTTRAKAKEIQRKAQEVTGAALIGSAIHAAGHPLLERDLPVVIALFEDRLDIYSYESPTPLTNIPITDIEAVKTVTYDNDRIPHTKVIDNTAQALQLEFRWQDKECASLFRKMRKIRPIGWYDAIQKSRLK